MVEENRASSPPDAPLLSLNAAMQACKARTADVRIRVAAVAKPISEDLESCEKDRPRAAASQKLATGLEDLFRPRRDRGEFGRRWFAGLREAWRRFRLPEDVSGATRAVQETGLTHPHLRRLLIDWVVRAQAEAARLNSAIAATEEKTQAVISRGALARGREEECGRIRSQFRATEPGDVTQTHREQLVQLNASLNQATERVNQVLQALSKMNREEPSHHEPQPGPK